MYKLSNKGFGLIPVLLTLLILGSISGVGYYVYLNNASDNKKQTVKTNNTSSTEPNNSAYNEVELTKYCDEREKACISYDKTWEKTTTVSKDTESNIDRTSIKLVSNKYPGLTVNFRPYVYGIGGGCLEGFVVKANPISKAKSLYVYEAYSITQERSEGVANGPKTYLTGMSVISDTESKFNKVGNTDCLNIGVYTNNNYTDKRVAGVLSISYSNNKNAFTLESEAKNWFNGAEAQAGRKVLQSLSLQ